MNDPLKSPVYANWAFSCISINWYYL